MASGPLITRIDRYIMRQLFTALFAVTLGLVALIWLTQSLRFVELIVNHGLSFGVFMKLTGLLIPSFIAVILPITTFVVVQFVYQRLAGDRELTVMRSAGMSPYALARPALAVITFSVCCCYALNIWLLPLSYTSFREYEFEIRNRMAAFLLQEGVFTQVSDNLTIYIRSRDQDGTLHGIVVDDGRQPTSHATILAERGRLLTGPNGPRVLLQNGSREELDRQSGRLNILTFAENTVDLAQASNGTADGRVRDANEMSVGELLHPTASWISPQDRPKFIVEAHKRLSSPLTAASFAMVALVSVLTGAFRRHGGILRPIVAIMTVVVLLALSLAMGNLAARAPMLVPMIWVVAAAPALLCAWLLFVPQVLARHAERRTRSAPPGATSSGAV